MSPGWTHLLTSGLRSKIWSRPNLGRGSRACDLHFKAQRTKTTDKYFAKKKAIASELAAAGKILDDDELIGAMLNGLDKSYNPLIAAINANGGTILPNLFS
jgi:hypothetical protein